MIGIVAKLTVKDGAQKEFEEVMTALAKDVRANEPGNVIYDLMLKSGSTTEYYVMEQYKDEAAAAAHSASAHFRAAGPKLGACLDGRPDIIRLESRG
jgi:quinol monooxygenase YgiN